MMQEIFGYLRMHIPGKVYKVLYSTRSQDCVAHSQNLEIVCQSRDCAANLEIVQNFCIILRLHSFWAQSQDFTCTISDPLHECKEGAALQ